MDKQHHADPAEAHREGIHELEREPHHATTEHEKPAHTPASRVDETPGEQHRGGPLPYQKR